MRHNAAMKLSSRSLLALTAFAMPPLALAQQGDRTVYRCPGTPVLYTDSR